MLLALITGTYGMNFGHMPGLDWESGFATTLLFMAALAGAVLLYFKTKGWL